MLPEAGRNSCTPTTPPAAARIGVPVSAWKSRPECSADWPLIGPRRQPKPEPAGRPATVARAGGGRRWAARRLQAPAKARTRRPPRNWLVGGDHLLADMLVEQTRFEHR